MENVVLRERVTCKKEGKKKTNGPSNPPLHGPFREIPPKGARAHTFKFVFQNHFFFLIIIIIRYTLLFLILSSTEYKTHRGEKTRLSAALSKQYFTHTHSALLAPYSLLLC